VTVTVAREVASELKSTLQADAADGLAPADLKVNI
jgi:hypothetical protein